MRLDMTTKLRRIRRNPTRRERLAARVDDLAGRVSWRVTRWWTRGFRAEVRRSAKGLARR
jgi:hypothetical protein